MTSDCWQENMHILRSCASARGSTSKRQKGRPNLRDLAARYRHMVANNEEAVRDMAQLGHVATVAARLKPKGISAFGKTSRELRACQLKRSREATWKLSEGLQPLDRSKMLASQTFLRQGDLTATIGQVGKIMKLQGWEATVGQTFGKECQLTLSSLSKYASCMTPVPSPLGPILHLAGKAHKEPELGAAWASWSHETNLGKALEEEWVQRHLPLQH
eukprot:6491732-Amphidinium_carterae.2